MVPYVFNMDDGFWVKIQNFPPPYIEKIQRKPPKNRARQSQWMTAPVPEEGSRNVMGLPAGNFGNFGKTHTSLQGFYKGRQLWWWLLRAGRCDCGATVEIAERRPTYTAHTREIESARSSDAQTNRRRTASPAVQHHVGVNTSANTSAGADGVVVCARCCTLFAFLGAFNLSL